MEVNERKCFRCGRIGTAAFKPLDPHDRTPYRLVVCVFEPACMRRQFANAAAKAAEETALGEPFTPVDLDPIQDTE